LVAIFPGSSIHPKQGFFMSDNDRVKHSTYGQSVVETPIEGMINAHRRRLMKIGASAFMMTGMGTMLTACGGSDNDDDAADGTPPASSPGGTTPPTAKVSSFGLAVLPDTQFYSRYATAETGNQFRKQYGTEPYLAQTLWLAKNAASLQIPFVTHLGDVVDQQDHEQQWQVADNAMAVLEQAKLPYSICAGNHDIIAAYDYDPAHPSVGTDADRDLTAEPYLKWFGPDRASRQATFGGRDASGFHEYHTFEAQGQRFLVLSLSWAASEAAIAWANDVLRKNPTLPTILISHALIGIANDAITADENEYGLMLWEKLIKGNDQIFMTLNGHIHGAAHLTKINDFGHAVEEMVVDYQMAYQGGNALMRFYEFDLTNNQIKALSFSPWVPEKPQDKLNSYDQAMLTEINQQFVIEMNFAERFGGFNRTFQAAEASNDSLASAASAMILTGYTEPKPIAAVPPTDRDDYPVVADTVAHWRFVGGQAGSDVPEGQVIPDLSGNGYALTRGAGTAQAVSLQWTDDCHRLSAAGGSIAFPDPTQARVNYFQTALGAAINAMTFTDGYTIEAFVKIGKGWTAANNAFMSMMSRAGRRGNLPDFGGSLPQSPPLQFAFSNLREIQWEVRPAQAPDEFAADGNISARANWSGEVMIDTWLHVAAVNDPATKETMLYVEGAPVLRNTIDTIGLATLGDAFPWTIGGGFWDGDGPGSGFLGSISEIRIVAKPLDADQWLTARRKA